MPPVYCRALAASFCALLASASSHAQLNALDDPNPENATLTLREALDATLASHPQLQAFGYRLEAQRARVLIAEQRPTLEATLDVENFAGTGDLEASHAAEITLGVSSLFERRGKRTARVSEAQSSIELLTFEQQVQALDVLAETSRRFIAVAGAQRALGLAQERAEQNQRTLDLVVPRVEAARSPPTEKLSAEIDLKAAQVALENARSDLDAAQFALVSQWNAPHERPRVNALLDSIAEPRAFERLAHQAEEIPDLQRYAAEERVREAQLRLARTQGVADWRWSAGIRRIEEFNEQALVVGLSVPLGTRSRSAPAITEAQSTLAQVAYQRDERRLELLSTLYSHWQAMRQAQRVHRGIVNEQLPLAREALALTERGYRIGRFPYRDLSAAQHQVLALQAQALDAAMRYHVTRIEVERLTGAQLSIVQERAQ